MQWVVRLSCSCELNAADSRNISSSAPHSPWKQVEAQQPVFSPGAAIDHSRLAEAERLVGQLIKADSQTL